MSEENKAFTVAVCGPIRESVGTASKVPACATCGNKAAFDDHQKDSPNYHIFRTEIKKKNSKDNGGIVLPDDPTRFVRDSVA